MQKNTIFVAVIGAAFGFGASLVVFFFLSQGGKIFPGSDLAVNVQKEKIVREDTAVISVVEETTPSVVSVVVTKDIPVMRRFFNSPFHFFFDPSPPAQGRPDQSQEFERQKIGGGTGFFITADGMIVTNRHVVSDPDADYTVITADGTEHEATVLARDTALDFAIVKIEGENFPAVEFGDSDGIKIGQTVVAIGNSLGEFANTVSRGIVSGLQRDIVAGSGFGRSERLNNIIQTDAAINPGNSGGPLLDITGKVIGINTAVASGAENIGFAIPINQLKDIITQVKETGKISRPYLGVRYVFVNEAIKEQLRDFPFDHGVLVTRGSDISEFAVVPGSPADKAEIAENNVILELDGQKIDQENQLASLLAAKKVGDTITLKVWRGGEVTDVDVELAELE